MYLDLLKQVGGNEYIARIADIVFSLSQKIKFYFRYGKKDYPIHELTQLSKILNGDTTDLREKLMESSILPDLFR